MASKTITVSNATQLAAAIKVATGGETINLNPGNYGALTLYKFNPASMVTIQSATATKAHFDAATLNAVTNVTFDNLDLGRALANGESVDNGYMLMVSNGGNLNFRNLDVHGSVNHNPIDDKRGMRVDSSHDIQIDGSVFHDLYAGLWVNKSTAVALTNSTIYEVREGLDVSGVHHMLIDHNQIYSVIGNYVLDPTHYTAATGDHPDMIQFWTVNAGPSDDVTISNNALLLGRGMDSHGIFMTTQDNSRYSNVLIENNLISTNNLNGITVEHMDGAIIRNNTVLRTGDTYMPSINVHYSNSIKVVDNISTYYGVRESANVASTGNIRAHVGGAMDATNVLTMFTNPLKAGSTSASDFTEINGGLAARSGVGFDLVAFNAPVSFAANDALTHALDAGSYLHHIA